jgi:hypothetical protein
VYGITNKMVEHFLMAALLLLLFGAIVFLVCRRS